MCTEDNAFCCFFLSLFSIDDCTSVFLITHQLWHSLARITYEKTITKKVTRPIKKLSLTYHDCCLSRVMRYQTVLVSDKVRRKPTCVATEDRWKLESLDLRRSGIVLYECSENKHVDQLCSYCTADLRLCFCIRKMFVFV